MEELATILVQEEVKKVSILCVLSFTQSLCFMSLFQSFFSLSLFSLSSHLPLTCLKPYLLTVSKTTIQKPKPNKTKTTTRRKIKEQEKGHGTLQGIRIWATTTTMTTRSQKRTRARTPTLLQRGIFCVCAKLRMRSANESKRWRLFQPWKQTWQLWPTIMVEWQLKEKRFLRHYQMTRTMLKHRANHNPYLRIQDYIPPSSLSASSSASQSSSSSSFSSYFSSSLSSASSYYILLITLQPQFPNPSLNYTRCRCKLTCKM